MLLRNNAVERESYNPWQIERANWSRRQRGGQRAVVGDGTSGGCVCGTERGRVGWGFGGC